MATKINLKNVGWRAFVDNVTALPGFKEPPNGAETTKATLDQIAVNVNEHEDRLRALEAAAPGPFFP